MKGVIWGLLFISLVFAACEDNANTTSTKSTEKEVLSTNEFNEFFYPYDTVPKIYVYRDLTNGIEEEFHRVFGINDSEGAHVVVEVYKSDGRITEALNYNIDSLDILDHMVVDKDQINRKAELFKNRLIPTDKKTTASFASRFPGISDSTLFLKEVDRIYNSTQEIQVMDKTVSAVVFHDYIRLTLFNPFTKMENEGKWELENYFAKGYGLVEWHTPDKNIHYQLEKIISQDEFVNLMSN